MALRKILEAAGKSTGFTNEEKGDYSDIVEYIIEWYFIIHYSNANLYTKLSRGIVKCKVLLKYPLSASVEANKGRWSLTLSNDSVLI